MRDLSPEIEDGLSFYGKSIAARMATLPKGRHFRLVYGRETSFFSSEPRAQVWRSAD
jgi:hypothetical protein